jgi:hypothetical protein
LSLYLNLQKIGYFKLRTPILLVYHAKALSVSYFGQLVHFQEAVPQFILLIIFLVPNRSQTSGLTVRNISSFIT